MKLHITNQVFLKGLAQAAVLTKWPEAWPLSDLHLNVPKIGKPIQEALLKAEKPGVFLKYFIETSATGLSKDDIYLKGLAV